MELRNAIFDMDGVITDTAQIHFKAWKQIFDDYLEREAEQKKTPFKPFTLDDYTQYVDGLSRTDGIKFFLQSRNLIESKEHLQDEESKLIEQIAALKNQVFLQLVAEEGVNLFQSTIDLIMELKKNNIKTAVISSSKNCKDILTQAEVINLFDAVVDGKELKQFQLKGKPNPDIFLEAAKRINANPQETLVVEDAMSGIIAGKAGHFGLVIGIDRQNKWAQVFKEQGADIVVRDLSELKLSEIKSQINISSLSHHPIFLAGQEVDEIKKMIGKREVIIFFDYDGTLTPIVSRPDLAVLSNEMKVMLRILNETIKVVIVSGRELENLQNVVGIPSLYYAGNHGFEITGPSHFATKFELGKECQVDILKAKELLKTSLQEIEGCIIEYKKLTLSVHYRLVAEEQISKVAQIVEVIAAQFPSLAVHLGKKVLELRPSIDWNKGKAVELLLKTFNANYQTYCPIYIGDDVTDEDAFSIIKNKGIGILIAEKEKKSHADFRLSDPDTLYTFLKKLNMQVASDDWSLSYPSYLPEEEKLRETLCVLGNGYVATRGAGAETQADDIHYPGTYFAGCYNRLKSVIAEKAVYNEDLVNMPNWLPITFKEITDEAWFEIDQVEVLDFHQELNFKKGILTRHISIQDKKGRISSLIFTRFVSMANYHLAVQKFTLQPENWSGRAVIKSGIDGSIINAGVTRYRDLNSKHLEALKVRSYANGRIALVMRTNQSHIEVGYMAIHRVYQHDQVLKIKPVTEEKGESVYCFFECDVASNQAVHFEKIVSVATNKDMARRSVLTDTRNLIRLHNDTTFDELLAAHVLAWQALWQRCDIHIDSTENDQQIIRLHIFHLLQTVSKNSIDLDIGLPARGWHGESYRGHIFWDELFIMPFYNFYFPQMAKSLLMYRYRRLDLARLLAKKSGFKGAMYPWQSGSNGDEATQSLHLNPRSNEWLPDFSHYQRHVNAAIVYNIWQYFLTTRDLVFMEDYGGELILEIARFWASITIYNQEIDRYEIHHVVGPDEYHERYADSDEPGVNNNAYTNVMAVWSIERALEILALLRPIRAKELKMQLAINDEIIEKWKLITQKMKIPFQADGIINQFDGYEDLQEFKWEYYSQKYGKIERLDRILKAENDTPDRYQVAKQADVLMLFYLFSLEELTLLLSKLGYEFNEALLKKNINYYLLRTSHGSTLSKVVLASLKKYLNPQKAVQYYQDVLDSDIFDTQGGTTTEGVHLGAMASCININLQTFAGISIQKNGLHVNPQLPDRIHRLKFNLQFQQKWLHFDITQNQVQVSFLEPESGKLAMWVNGKQLTIEGKK